MHSHKPLYKTYMEYYNLSKDDANKIVDLFEKNIPARGYVDQVIALALKESKVYSASVVRLVKNGFSKNQELFNILMSYANSKASEAVAAEKLTEKHLNNIK